MKKPRYCPTYRTYIRGLLRQRQFLIMPIRSLCAKHHKALQYYGAHYLTGASIKWEEAASNLSDRETGIDVFTH